MDLCNQLCLFGQPMVVRLSVCSSYVVKILSFAIAYKLQNQNTFIPAFFMGVMDLCQYIPLPVALTLAEDHKVSGKQKLLASVLIQMSIMLEQHAWPGH